MSDQEQEQEEQRKRLQEIWQIDPEKDARRSEPITPYTQASWWSRLTFHWANEFVVRGGKRALNQQDIFPVGLDMESERLATKFISCWIDEELQTKTGKRPSLKRALWKAFGGQHLYVGFIGALDSLSKIATAVLLGYLLTWFKNSGNDQGTLNKGIILAVSLCLVVFIAAFLHHQLFFASMTFGMRVRLALTSAIYRKCLRTGLTTSNNSPDEDTMNKKKSKKDNANAKSSGNSSGKLLNIISNDAQKFDEAGTFLHFLYLGPFETVISFIFIVLQLGWLPAVAGITIIAVMFPIQSGLARIYAKLRKPTLDHRDERIRCQSDMFHGIQIIKYYGWEESFLKRILAIRENELYGLRRTAYLKALNEAIFIVSPYFISLAAFSTLILGGSDLDPSAIFSSIALFNNIRLSMTNYFPHAIQMWTEILINLRRIESLLVEESRSTNNNNKNNDIKYELKRNTNETTSLSEKVVTLSADNLSFYWNEKALKKENIDGGIELQQHDTNTALEGLNFKLRAGELCAVVGPFGSGKSTLLLSILGELKRSSSDYSIENIINGDKGSIFSYASQKPWILNTSIKENILFGHPYEKEHFDRVIKACALDVDFEAMPAAEETLLGERGYNISGGQKARIGLARALYRKDAHIFLLDDVMSAVDNRVSNVLFQNIFQLLRVELKKCVLLVTHQLQFLQKCDKILVLEGGNQTFFGTFEEQQLDPRVKEGYALVIANNSHHNTKSIATNDGTGQDEELKLAFEEMKNETIQLVKASEKEKAVNAQNNAVQEDRTLGAVEASTYFNFIRSGGGFPIATLLALAFVANQIAMIMADRWLAVWSVLPSTDQHMPIYLQTYIVIIAIITVIAIIRSLAFFKFMLDCISQIFAQMLISTLHARMSFFQLNPHGRILNRFTKDLSLADEQLPYVSSDALVCFFIVFGVIGVIGYVIPWVLIAFPLIGVSFLYLRNYYLRTSREVKRLEAISRSPYYQHIGSSVDAEGLVQIRAFGEGNRFIREFSHLQNENSAAFFAFLFTSRWLGFRLDILAALYFSVSVAVAVPLRTSISAGLLGLGLSYVLQLISLVQWCTRQMAEVENLMTSVERMIAFTKIDPEIYDPPNALSVPSNWPSAGKIEFKGLNLSYDNDSGKSEGERALVLKSINLVVNPGERLAIVGRTGAGKSSLVSSLFRLVESEAPNSLLIDNLPIDRIKLSQLRPRISIIPQEPFLFKGTIRFNLDPLDQATDAMLWDCLATSQLHQLVSSLPSKLDASVSENGSNFSVGERQLFCLARALLNRTRNCNRILVLDEATASIDLETTDRIQSIFASQVGTDQSCTILTIAHRLQTIIGYDRICVLDKGSIVELGRPRDLVALKNGIFLSMIKELGQNASKALLDQIK